MEFAGMEGEFGVIKNRITGATERVFKGNVDLDSRNPRIYCN